MDRRSFIRNALTGSAAVALGFNSENLYASDDFIKLTVLHTNDVHSRIDPFPSDDKKYAGMGGVGARSALINKIRAEERNVLLFDAGDIVQGTPYFNFYGGKLEMQLMSMMRYDAATMGNHDFDNGLEGFLRQLPHANFPFLTANYDFADTPLAKHTKGYQLFEKDGLKVGVFGLGIELTGLVNKHQYGNTVYLDPVRKMQELESYLKHERKCDFIICLSHLGYKYLNDKVSDVVIAEKSTYLDLVIGGHTHTFLSAPDVLKNSKGKQVLVNQVGFAGLNLGRLDFVFERNTRGKRSYASVVEPVNGYLKN